jgi:hypothetical protein
MRWKTIDIPCQGQGVFLSLLCPKRPRCLYTAPYALGKECTLLGKFEDGVKLPIRLHLLLRLRMSDALFHTCNSIHVLTAWFVIKNQANCIFAFLGAFAKLRKATISFVMSVRPSASPHGTTRLLLNGFS